MNHKAWSQFVAALALAVFPVAAGTQTVVERHYDPDNPADHSDPAEHLAAVQEAVNSTAAGGSVRLVGTFNFGRSNHCSSGIDPRRGSLRNRSAQGHGDHRRDR